MAHVPTLWRRLATPQMGIARSEGEDLILDSSNPGCPENKTTPKPFFREMNGRLCVHSPSLVNTRQGPGVNAARGIGCLLSLSSSKTIGECYRRQGGKRAKSVKRKRTLSTPARSASPATFIYFYGSRISVYGKTQQCQIFYSVHIAAWRI
jgi:hypothetical protein